MNWLDNLKNKKEKQQLEAVKKMLSGCKTTFADGTVIHGIDDNCAHAILKMGEDE